MSDDFEMVQIFLSYGVTTLQEVVYHASFWGHLDVVHCMLDAKPVAESVYNIALISACCGGHLSIVKYLVDDATEFDWALHEACREGHLEIVEVLIQALKSKTSSSKEMALLGDFDQALLTSNLQGHRQIAQVLTFNLIESRN